METHKDTVRPTRFKKRLDLDGVATMQDALNVLALFQSWRSGETVRSADELGLRSDLITAALHYVLSKYKAQKPMFRCSICKYNRADLHCTRGNQNCLFKRAQI